ncbi:MAG: YceI family protein [Spongiibacteraceae bacterium]
MKKALFILSLLVFVSASNALELDLERSQLQFISVKKQAVAEAHYFDSFAGSLDEKTGLLQIDVTLNSVNTGIAIRDQRLQQFLFHADKFPVAQYRARIDMAALENLRLGSQRFTEVAGELVLRGLILPVKFKVLITALDGGEYSAVTVGPGLVDASKGSLLAGIEKLKELAGLASIASVVPVSFYVVFH